MQYTITTNNFAFLLYYYLYEYLRSWDQFPPEYFSHPLLHIPLPGSRLSAPSNCRGHPGSCQTYEKADKFQVEIRVGSMGFGDWQL
jgi:hypothetical protein